MKKPVLFVLSETKEINGIKYICEFGYIKESLIYSIISDLFTFGILILGFYINHFYIGSKLLSLILLTCFLVMANSTKKMKISNKEEFMKRFNEAMEDNQWP